MDAPSTESANRADSRSDGGPIRQWAGADDKTRQRKFSPAQVRIALDLRDGYEEKKRERQYKILCEYAAHASVRGFRLTMREGMGEIGPFVETDNLRGWIEELILRLGPAAILFAQQLPRAEPSLKQFLLSFGAELVKGVKRDDAVSPAHP